MSRGLSLAGLSTPLIKPWFCLGDGVANEHIPLLEAIRSGDPDQAAAAAHAHIVSTVCAALTRLSGSAGDLLEGTPIPKGVDDLRLPALPA